MTRFQKVTVYFVSIVMVLVIMLTVITLSELRPVPDSLIATVSDNSNPAVLDHEGRLLKISHNDKWNIYHQTPFSEIPQLLRDAFIVSEDRRFYKHSGIDWQARLHAVWQNIKAGRAVRGASTLTEQVVRMIHPRPRTLWSRWLEGWEARRLEARHSKTDLLEFYLNQVPYAANRRGVNEAADYYFNRTLDTLSQREMLTLALLVRAPSRFDLYKNPGALDAALNRLAQAMVDLNVLHPTDVDSIIKQSLTLERHRPKTPAHHFINYVSNNARSNPSRPIRTPLDQHLQTTVQALLDQRIESLSLKGMHNGAVLVVDHTSGDVLAWVVAGNQNRNTRSAYLDPILMPRQPGSTLKPFLYALALEDGWTPATRISDTPLVQRVGHGLHTYRNYSRMYYGPVSLREALGNSLNTPAVRTVAFVGAQRYLQKLRQLGFASLDQHPDFYGDGLALGNGEVTLLELVRAYTALARGGQAISINTDWDTPAETGAHVFSNEVSTLIAHILSDPSARALEFGENSVLNLPHQTAVKTGTSNDFRDAWSVGFNDRYTVGVWMGNLDATPTRGLTGSTGPALVLRSVFLELNRHRETRALKFSPNLQSVTLCKETGKRWTPGDDCHTTSEWFLPGTQQAERAAPDQSEYFLRQPTPGLELAMDPRIPDEQEAFEFHLEGVAKGDRVEWHVDDQIKTRQSDGRFLWPLSSGEHWLRVSVWRGDSLYFQSKDIEFHVQ